MKKSIFAGAALLALALSAHSTELFVNIHSGQAMAQGAGLVLAGQALAQKAPVRVLLCDAAGDIAVVGQNLPKLVLLSPSASRCGWIAEIGQICGRC